eukprot:TRINITY_DN3049_c0_g1_i1.p1 TRINITY_DN3049_c0_g1~~TRINITY_DN3049_c0_g1_i1.p1  ORF type:complete len:1069 (+),score=113.97 TRINITY_DN3049_c0_g1_i1:26-3208(+)
MKTSVSVLSLNLNLLPGLSLANGADHGFATERATEFLRMAPQYDLLLLQEVFSTPHLPFICRQQWFMSQLRMLGFSHILRGRQPSLTDLLKEKKWTDSGLMIASKFKILDGDDIIFHSASHLDAGASKGVLYAQLKISNDTVMVFNCHLQASHSQGKYSHIRVDQLKQLRRFIAEKTHFSPGVPWLLAGDFNIDAIKSDPHRSSLYRPTIKGDETDDYKMMIDILDPSGTVQDLLKIKAGYHPATRPPREYINLFGIFKHKSKQRLDYLFWMPGEEGKDQVVNRVESTEVVPFRVEDKPFSYISDHFGISTELTTKNPLTSSSFVPPVDTPINPSDWVMEKIDLAIGFVSLGIVVSLGYSHGISTIFWFLVLFILSRSAISYILRPIIIQRRNNPTDESVGDLLDSYVQQYTNGPAVGEHEAFQTGDGDNFPSDSLCQNFQWSCADNSFRQCLGYRRRVAGELLPFSWLTYDDVSRRANNFAAGLCVVAPNLKRGDAVLIVAENHPEWVICEQACMLQGFIVIPTSDLDTARRVIDKERRAHVVVCSIRYSLDIIRFVGGLKEHSIDALIQFQESNSIDYELVEKSSSAGVKVIPFEAVEKKGMDKNRKGRPVRTEVEDPDAIITLIYAFRSNGDLKTIPITNRNMVGMCRNFNSAHRLAGHTLDPNHDTHLSSFPLARMYERVAVWTYLQLGIPVAFQHSHSQFFDDTQAARPSVLYCIPNDFTKLCSYYKMAISSWSYSYRVLYNIIVYIKRVCNKMIKHKQGGKFPRLVRAFIDFMVFSRFSQHLGGRVRLILVSSAGHIPKYHRKFLGLIFCCKVEECYIRTETGIISSTQNKTGTAGFPITNVKIVPNDTDDTMGEIWVSGPNVTRAYGKLQEERYENGWFNTLQIGFWNPDATLTVLGHKGEMLLVENGKVFPRELEYIYIESDFIQQIVIYARKGQPLVAIVTPDYEYTYRWAKKRKVQSSYKKKDLYQNEELRKAIMMDLDKIAKRKRLEDYQKIRCISLQESLIPELLLLQRNSISNEYGSVIDSLYRELETGGSNISPQVSIPSTTTEPV